MGWSSYESFALGITPLTPRNCSRMIRNWANTGLKEFSVLENRYGFVKFIFFLIKTTAMC